MLESIDTSFCVALFGNSYNFKNLTCQCVRIRVGVYISYMLWIVESMAIWIVIMDCLVNSGCQFNIFLFILGSEYIVLLI